VSARLFVALELPADVRARLAAFGHAAAGDGDALRPVAEDALHLTLAFLGHRDLGDVEPAAAVVRETSADAIALALGEPLWLAPRRPQVLTVALEDRCGALGALRDAVVGRLAYSLDWEPDRRRFRPHVTVARVRRGARPGRDLPAPPQATFAAEAVTLFRSHLGRGPARYEALERLALSSQ
jgi:2'-5' RNA ligase